MGTKSKLSKIQRIITFPIRALVKARDSYVKGMTSFGEKGAYGGFTTAPPSSHSSRLPKSYNVSSSGSDDMAELIRAASVKRLGGRLTEELTRRPVTVTAATPASGAVPRSCSVGMGKIDENTPCEFDEEDVVLGVVKAEVLYPRSKSYAVARRSPSVY